MSEGDLQIEFLLLANGVVGYAGKQVKSFAQLGNRFDHRSTCDRTLACLEPISDCVLY